MNTPSRDFHSPAPYGKSSGANLTMVGSPDTNRLFNSAGSVHSHDGGQGEREATSDHSRSPSPQAGGFQPINKSQKSTAMGIKTMLSEDDPGMNPPPAAMPKKGPGRGNWRRNKERSEPQPILPNTPSFGFVHESPAPNTPAYGVHGSPSGSISFLPLSTKDHIPTPSYQSAKRNRPLTSHQQAVSEHRRGRIGQILDIGIKKRFKAAKRKREDEGVIIQAWKRIRMLPSGWDSEDEGLDKPKEDSKDKDKDDNGKNKIKEEDKQIAALRRAACGVTIPGGFRLPKTDKDMEREKSHGILDLNPEDDDDFGEQALYLVDVLKGYKYRLQQWDHQESNGAPLREPLEQTHPYQADWELENDYEGEQEELTATLTPRPRQARKRGGATAGSRKSKGGASTPSVAATADDGKDDPKIKPPPRDDDDDETMVDGDGEEESHAVRAPPRDLGELDDEDRELLDLEGEGGDDSEEEEDGDDMDED